MKYYYIYKTTNLVNGKIYIGKRVSVCLPKLDSYLGSGKILKRSIALNGRENFSKDILEIVNQENCNEREIYWIAFYNSTNPEIGYNISIGGQGGDIVGLMPNKTEIYKKQGKARTGKKNPKQAAKMKGRVFSEEHKRKLRVERPWHSDLMRGRKFSEEHRANMSSSSKLRIELTCPHCGVTGKSSMKAKHFDNCLSINPNRKSFKTSEETKKLLSKKAIERPKQTCNYCGKSGGKGSMGRWHGENCKLSPNYKAITWKCSHCDVVGTNITNYNKYHGKNCRNLQRM